MVSFLGRRVPKLGSHVFTSAAISVQDGNIIGDHPGEQVSVTRPSMEAMDEDGPWPRVGAHQNSSHILLDGALAPRRGRVKGQTIYSLTWPLPREGAYQLSNHILLDGALASRGGISKVKPYTS